MSYFKKHTDNKERGFIFFITLLTSGLVSVLFYSQVSFYTIADNSIYDFYSKSTKRAGTTDLVVIADIDETSLAGVGQWPWQRYRIATLLQSTQQHSPALIGVDVFFPEPDSTSLNTIKESFDHDFGLNLEFTGIPQGLDDSDGFLGQVISKSPVVGAKYFSFDHTNNGDQCNLKTLAVRGDLHSLTLEEAPGILCNIEPIETQYKSSGFINSQFDNDGVLRRMSLLIKYGDKIYPNLSLAMLAQYAGTESIEITKDIFGLMIKINDFKIPIDKKGRYQLRFPGPSKSHQIIPAIDILNNAVPAKNINGKMILLGVSAAGIGDRHHTIFDPSFPGTEVHAVFLSNVMNKQFIRIPDWQPSFVIILSVLTCLVSGLIFSLRSPIQATFLTCSWLAAIAGLSFFIFTSQGLYLSPTGPLFASSMMVILCSLFRYIVENRHAIAWHKQLVQVQQVTLEAMATVAENRDPETGGHIQRTKRYAKVLAKSLRTLRNDNGIITDVFIQELYDAVPLHDVGKVSIPDRILLKPGPLTEEEYSEMKHHSEYGAQIIESAAIKLDDKRFLEIAHEIAIAHHEKWDGSGYPNGLKGEAIPLSGRLMAVVDVYDALISRRHYKEAYSHKVSKAIILKGIGTHFDPVIIEAFIAVEDEFAAIAREYEDGPREF